MPAQSDDVTKLLAAFPGPLRLAPSRKKWTLLLFSSIVFVLLGFHARHDSPWAGWFGVVFFGCGVLISVAMLIPHSGGLALDENAFEITNLFRRKRISWRSASCFEAVTIPPSQNKVVVYNDAAVNAGAFAQINASITDGRNSVLPDNYGLASDTLADLMNQWNERANRPG